MLRLIARRARSQAELLGRLQTLGLDSSAAQETVERLRRVGLVDDQALAASVAERTRDRGHGHLRVEHDLQRLQVDPGSSAEALAEQPDRERRRAHAVVVKRFGAIPTDPRDLARASALSLPPRLRRRHGGDGTAARPRLSSRAGPDTATRLHPTRRRVPWFVSVNIGELDAAGSRPGGYPGFTRRGSRPSFVCAEPMRVVTGGFGQQPGFTRVFSDFPPACTGAHNSKETRWTLFSSSLRWPLGSSWATLPTPAWVPAGWPTPNVRPIESCKMPAAKPRHK